MIDKNKKKADAKKERVWYGFNTGERVHKTLKNYDRKFYKKDLRKMLDN